MQDVFRVGQRWISDAEPDLGLGTVDAVAGRQVRIRFAAADAVRTYNPSAAPLSRARFAPDDRVADRDGRELSVVACDEQAGLIAYRCTTVAGDTVTLPETDLDDRLRLNRPQDRLLSRRLDADVWFHLRHQAWLRQARQWRSPVFGLCGPRVDLIPHQLFIAAEVAGRAAPRVLLADEVGLGKTIEAGLILHRLLLSRRVARVLVVVPDALVNQWLVEMLRRFNLRLALFDPERFDPDRFDPEGSDPQGVDSEAGDEAKPARTGADNPFMTEQRVLCSLGFLTGSPEVARAVLDADWDLMIVDEAHHLEWSPGESSLAYELVEALAGRAAAVLLLTATPEQLGRAGHFGRLRLLDPARFHDFDTFVAEQAAYAPVARLAADLLDGRPLTAEQRALVGEWLPGEADIPRDELIDHLIDRHGTGRVLYRNTRHAITGFPARVLHARQLPLPDAYRASAASPTPEAAAGEGWAALDPRVAWLRELLATLHPQKVLVICAHARTAIALRDHLLERHAVHVALFHEGMEIVARDRAAAFFADEEAGAQALVCSEIGSEGRNFQFAHHLVLFDLPRDPDLLEQRIGRLDRIGQRETIQLHVPYFAGAAGEVLLRWYRDGLQSFAAVCAAGGEVHGRLAGRLDAALADPSLADDLVAEAARLTAELNRALEAGRDRLLELHSHHPAKGRALVEQIGEEADVAGLRGFITTFWDAYGLEHEAASGQALVLRRGAHMLAEHYPGLSGDALTVTFDRADALANEDRQFLTWEHPMVRGSLDILASGDQGSAAMTVCSHPDFRTGTVLLELLYLVEAVAPAGLEMQRFLPPTCVRLLLDGAGEDRAADYPAGTLEGLCLAQNHKLVETVMRSQAERIRLLLRHADGLAQARATGVIDEARGRMTRDLVAERDRLAALARVNPNVRADEIERIAVRQALLTTCLDTARVRLDAARVIVMR